jgi:hypothetical protein
MPVSGYSIARAHPAMPGPRRPKPRRFKGSKAAKRASRMHRG